MSSSLNLGSCAENKSSALYHTKYIAQSALRTSNRAELSDVDPKTSGEGDLVGSIGKHGDRVLLESREHLGYRV